MKVIETSIPEICIIGSTIFGHERRFFFENFNKNKFTELMGLTEKNRSL